MQDIDGSVLGTISFTGDASEESNMIGTGVDEVTAQVSAESEEITTPSSDTTEHSQEGVDEVEKKDNTSDGAKEMAKKYEALRKLQIDHIEEKLQEYENGKLSGEDLKRWFDSDATRAEIANGAMRVKQTYRKFVKTMSAPQEPQTQTSPSTFTPPADLDSLIEQKVQEKLGKIEAEKMQRVEEDVAKSFAGKFGVKDEQFNSLTNNAKALRTANPSWTYEQALQASYTILYPQKGSSVFVPSQPGATPTTTEEVVDLSKGFTITI